MKSAAMMVCAPKLADAPTIMTAKQAFVITVLAEMRSTVKAPRNVWVIECASTGSVVRRVVRLGASPKRYAATMAFAVLRVVVPMTLTAPLVFVMMARAVMLPAVRAHKNV